MRSCMDMGTVLHEILGDDFLLVEYVGMYQIHLYAFVRTSHAHQVNGAARPSSLSLLLSRWQLATAAGRLTRRAYA